MTKPDINDNLLTHHQNFIAIIQNLTEQEFLLSIIAVGIIVLFTAFNSSIPGQEQVTPPGKIQPTGAVELLLIITQML